MNEKEIMLERELIIEKLQLVEKSHFFKINPIDLTALRIQDIFLHNLKGKEILQITFDKESNEWELYTTYSNMKLNYKLIETMNKVEGILHDINNRNTDQY